MFLTMALFVGHHDLLYPRYAIEGGFDRSEEDALGAAIEGSVSRRVMLVSLGLFSVIGLIRKGFSKLTINGLLGWLMLVFVFWSFVSIGWAADSLLTFRRLTVFAILLLATMALATRWSLSYMPLFAFFSTALYLLIGLSAELILGTFHPSLAEYRFAGTVHPNGQGVNCAFMFLAAVSLAGCVKRGRSFFLIAALVAFMFLILTKSRTSFIGTLVAQILYWMVMSYYSKKSSFILSVCGTLSICWLIYPLFLIVGGDVIARISSGILLGRGDSEVWTLTGRTLLWQKCLEYVAERPLHGYGFNGFWTPGHIQEVATVFGLGLIDAHSVYIDLLLNLGLVGMILYVSIIGLGIKKSFDYYKETADIGYSFYFKVTIFCLIHGLLETGMMHMAFGTFLLLWGLVHLAFVSPSFRWR
ncbi:MAG: O-antigen ligase family protein [Pyrinomonadaceae bacterium]